MTKKFLVRVAPMALIALPLAACGSAETEEAEHAEEAEAPEGPHGGRLLTDGKLSVEVTIYEDGQDPQYRVYPYLDGKPLDPAKVNLQIALRRLGGQVDRFRFTPQKDYLAGNGVVSEPHSFDVEVVAVVDGKTQPLDLRQLRRPHDHHPRGRASRAGSRSRPSAPPPSVTRASCSAPSSSTLRRGPRSAASSPVEWSR